MTNFFDWLDRVPSLAKDSKWLVLGKGPSFSKIKHYDTSSYKTISLNHAVREVKVDIAHIIDFDVFEDCWQIIDQNADFVLLPWVPHIKNQPGNKTLEVMINENHHLHKFESQGRLLWYNLSTAKVFNQDVKADYPIVPVTFFSAEAVINLLAMAGVKIIRTLGIDGGSNYSSSFDDLKDKTLLSNGHQSFDIQFMKIMETVSKFNLDLSPLDVASTIKVYVGSMPEQMLAVKVLEYSIKKHTSAKVDVIPLFENNIKIPMPKDTKNRPRTPFSFQRFLIPQLNGYKGKAIYVDSDMQVFTNIIKLWSLPFEGGADVLSAYEVSESGRRPQFSVMLLDCEKLAWNIEDIVKKLDNGELNYESLMYEMKVAEKIGTIIPREWNSLEFYKENETCLIHYTDMHRQPWILKKNENGHLWVRELHHAVKDKFIDLSYVKKEVIKGHVRPSILWQIANSKYECINMPAKAYKLDRFFVPPHMRNNKTSKIKLFLNKLTGIFLSYYY